MKKTAELTGALLDYWVAKALGFTGRDLLRPGETGGWHLSCDASTLYGGSGSNQVWFATWRPSTEWRHGGPIIERERIALVPNTADSFGQNWEALVRPVSTYDWLESDFREEGPTPLIAAMRAFVASKLGEEVELP